MKSPAIPSPNVPQTWLTKSRHTTAPSSFRSDNLWRGTKSHNPVLWTVPLDKRTELTLQRHTLVALSDLFTIQQHFQRCATNLRFRYRHGFFDRPASLHLHSTLLPIFSSAKVSTFNDILFPSYVGLWGHEFASQ